MHQRKKRKECPSQLCWPCAIYTMVCNSSYCARRHLSRKPRATWKSIRPIQTRWCSRLMCRFLGLWRKLGFCRRAKLTQRNHSLQLFSCIAARPHDSFLTPLSFLHLRNVMQVGRPLQVVPPDHQSFRCITKTALCRLQPPMCYSR